MNAAREVVVDGAVLADSATEAVVVGAVLADSATEVVFDAVLVDFVTLNKAGVGVEIEVDLGTDVGGTPMNEVVTCVGVGKFMV